jgi:hypothetical protein
VNIIKSSNTRYLLGLIFAALLIMPPSPLLKEVAAGKPAPSEISTKNDSSPNSSFDYDDLPCIEIVRKSMLKSWAMTKGGMLESEHGFTVIKEGSAYGVLFSQNSNHFRRVSISVPIGSIAVFHVHPNSVPPEPSPNDMKQAKKIGIPVCTITSQGVYCYFPNSQKTIKMQDFSKWTQPCNSLVERP